MKILVNIYVAKTVNDRMRGDQRAQIALVATFSHKRSPLFTLGIEVARWMSLSQIKSGHAHRSWHA